MCVLARTLCSEGMVRHGTTGNIPSFVVVGVSGCLFQLVKRDSLILGSSAMCSVLYLVKAWCSTQAGFPHSACGGYKMPTISLFSSALRNQFLDTFDTSSGRYTESEKLSE